MTNEMENTSFEQEFGEGTNGGFDANIPTEENPGTAQHETYTLADGSQGSRAAFIREKFLTENMSRKQIAEEFGFPYRVVYSATVNMVNAAEAPARGRTAGNTNIKLTADGQVVVTNKEGQLLVDGAPYDEAIETLGELENKSRNEWIREQVEAGVSRGDLAKKLDMSYGVIYSLTKDGSGEGRQRIEIELPNGDKVSRADYIRMQFAAGVSRGDIAKELDVPYSVVWQATKVEKSDADKFADVINELKSFGDKVTDADLFGQVITALESIQIKAEEKKAEATEEAPEDGAPADFAE